jgi:riboflavin synthase
MAADGSRGERGEQDKTNLTIPPWQAVLDWKARRHYTHTVFTGLVETTGVLAERTSRGPGARLFIRAELAGEALAMGESITVDGACLSVVEIRADGFAVDATSETLARTTLGDGTPGKRVNLERALRAADRLGGHIVTGHVDAVGTLIERNAVGEAFAMTFSLPASLQRFVAEKGSITVAGVSLTVNAVRRGEPAAFDVMLIPITLRVTSLGDLAPGDRVNLEVDLVARYVAAWLEGSGR